MVRRLLLVALLLALLGNVWLSAWHQGYDTGYGAAMADSFLNVKTAEQYFQELINAAGHRVSH